MSTLSRWCMAVITGSLFLLSSYADVPDRPFVWADDENFKPLIYRDETGASKGIFYEVITEAFRRMKIPLKNRLYPWSRAQKIVSEGDADGMVTVYTRARRRHFKATDPIVTVEEHVFTHKENPKFEKILDIRSLKELKNFILVDTVDAGWSRENLKGMHVIWVPTVQSALNMIAARRADIYLMSNFTGPYLIKEQIEKDSPYRKGLEKIVMGRHPIAKMDYRLLIRKDSPYVNIIDRFNATLRRMRKDGTYQKIINRYKIDLGYRSVTKKRGKDE